MKQINAEPITRGHTSLLRYWKCTEDDNAVFRLALAIAQTLCRICTIRSPVWREIWMRR